MSKLKKRRTLLDATSDKSSSLDTSDYTAIRPVSNLHKYRASSKELRKRRLRVFALHSIGAKPRQIYVVLKKSFPTITLNKVYDDIEYTDKHKKFFEVLLINPDFPEHYEDAHRQINGMIREAEMVYTQAESDEAKIAGLWRMVDLATAKLNMNPFDPYSTLQKLKKSISGSDDGYFRVNLDSLKEVLE